MEANKAPMGHSWSYEGGARGPGPNAGRKDEVAGTVLEAGNGKDVAGE